MERPRRRKLLVASIGIAAVSYVVGVACDTGSASSPTSGNLPAPPPGDGAPADSALDQGITSGNLPAPPPPDASDASDASDGSDAGDAGGDAEAG